MVDRITPNIWTDYPKIPLPQVLSFIVDNRGKTVPTTETGHKLIATNCIRNENLYPSYEKIRFLSDDTYRNWFRAHPVPGDIIFVCKGTPGRVCMVPDPIDFCIAQDMVALRANEDIVYNRYLLVILRSAEIQKQIYNYSVGDVIPHFKKSFFDRLEIPIPPMKIQRAIGDFYFSFSLKIELNTQINHNLEEQAKAIFKSWFLDFSALDNPDFYSYEGVTCPVGWRVSYLADIADYLNGLAMQKYRPDEGDFGYPVLKIKELRQRMCDKDSERCSFHIKPEYIVHDGDVIFSWSGSLLVDFWCGGECRL